VKHRGYTALPGCTRSLAQFSGGPVSQVLGHLVVPHQWIPDLPTKIRSPPKLLFPEPSSTSRHRASPSDSPLPSPWRHGHSITNRTRPTCESTRFVPPCSRTIFDKRAIPSAVPRVYDRGHLGRGKIWKICQAPLSIATPDVRDRYPAQGSPRHPARRHGDPWHAPRRLFRGVSMALVTILRTAL